MSLKDYALSAKRACLWGGVLFQCGQCDYVKSGMFCMDHQRYIIAFAQWLGHSGDRGEMVPFPGACKPHLGQGVKVLILGTWAGGKETGVPLEGLV